MVIEIYLIGKEYFKVFIIVIIKIDLIFWIFWVKFSCGNFKFENDDKLLNWCLYVLLC